MGSGLTIEQKSLILGTLLGDGNIEKRWKNPRLRIDQSFSQKEYVFWKYDVLKNIATREPHILFEQDKRSGKTFSRWYFSTKALPDLEFYYRLFYAGKRKTIPQKLRNYFNNPLSLAVWLMDDGYKRSDCDAIRLSTDCFSYEENKILQFCLIRNFDICSKIHAKKDAWNIYIPSSEMKKMRTLL